MRKGSLRELIDGYSPDILMLQETKIAEMQIVECGVREEFSEYEQFYSFAKKPGYAGTAVWVKKELANEAIMISDVDGDGLIDAYGDLLQEGRLTVVELADFCVISAYVPNSKDDLSRLEIRGRWDEYLAGVLTKLQENKPLVVGGDFNVAHEPIDLARPKQNVGKHGYTDEERRGFNELLTRAGMIDTFRLLHPDVVKYSWWSHWGKARVNNVGWRIDYVLMSEVVES
jgi:exodeoxyribonuclease-3